VADQNNVAQLLPFHLVDNVENVRVEIDGGRQQMRALGEAGQRGRKYFVAAAGEQPSNPAPAPSAP
jgi:hypothetical protein